MLEKISRIFVFLIEKKKNENFVLRGKIPNKKFQKFVFELLLQNYEKCHFKFNTSKIWLSPMN